MRRRLAVAFSAFVAAVAFTVGGAAYLSAATTSTTIAAGDTLNVHCNGPTLNITQDGVDASLVCAPNPTTTTQPNGPDLVITAITPVPANPTAGQAVSFDVTIKNIGNRSVTGKIGTGLSIDGGPVVRWVEGTNTYPPGGSVTRNSCSDSCWYTPNWTATNGTHTVSGTADEKNVVAETNEANNPKTASFTIGQTTTTTTAPPTTTAPTTTTAPPTSGDFQVNSAGRIIPPGGGAAFVANGANVGVPCSFDWNGNALAPGAADSAKNSWNWTAVRVNAAWAAPGAFGCDVNMTANVQAVIDQYTSRGIVTIIASHDYMLFNREDLALQGMRAIAAANKSNPRVWFNCHNEPPNGGSHYVDLQKRCIDAVRGEGATQPIVMDGQNSSNDASWDGVPPGAVYDHCVPLKAYDPRHNVVMSIHNYGGHPNAADLGNWTDQTRAAGCEMIIGEFGPAVGGSVSLDANFSVGPAKGVGLLAWHGTHSDDSSSFRTDGGPFYGTAPLNAFGQRVWNVTH